MNFDGELTLRSLPQWGFSIAKVRAKSKVLTSSLSHLVVGLIAGH